MTVTGVRAASATATAVLPTPVGPTMTGVWCLVSGTAKPPFQFLFGELHHTRPSMRVVRLSRLDRGSTRVGRGEALQPILPAPKSPAGEIGDELLQAACGLEARMRVRRRVYDDAAAGEWLDLVADARQQLPMRVDRIELGSCEVERER